MDCPHKERPRLCSHILRARLEGPEPEAKGCRETGRKALGSALQGQGQVWAGCRQPAPPGSQALTMGRLHRCHSPVHRKMWEPRAAASPLPQPLAAN